MITRSLSLAIQSRVQNGALLNQPPSIIRDGNTVAWYDSSLLSSITKDGSNIVSRVNDKLGSGHDLKYGGFGWNAVDGFTFNGTTQYGKTDPFVFVQPEKIYIVVKFPIANISKYALDGNSLVSGGIQRDWFNSDHDTRLVAGANTTRKLDLLNNTWGILTVLFNGTNSILRINTVSASVENAGVNNMGGITIGCSGAGTMFANMCFKEAIFRKVVDTAPNELLIYNYLAKKYSIV